MAGPSIRGLGNQSGAEIGAEQAENRVNRNAAMSGVIETSISSERIFALMLYSHTLLVRRSV